MDREILVGDVIDKLKEIPDESIDVMITSPPYWGLRDYGVDKQWGSEKSFRDYLDKLDKLMVEMKRVLKKTGSCWINLGDTYSTISGGMRDLSRGITKKYGKVDYGVGHAHTGDSKQYSGRAEAYSVDQSKMYEGLQTKSRVGIPERFYINCIDNEWIARNHIPWHKNNPMPSSVKDRFSNKWESIFFFVKNPKYYFDLDAVRERTITHEKRKTRIQYDGKSADTSAFMPPNPKGKNPGDMFENFGKYEDKETETKHRQGMNRERGDGTVEKRNLPTQKEFVDKLRGNFSVDDIVECGLERSTVEHWFRYDESGFSFPDAEDWHKVGTDLFPELLEVYYVSDEIKQDQKGKNPGDYFDDADNLTETAYQQNLAIHDNKSLPGPNSIMWKKPPKAHAQFHERQDIARKEGADHADWANDPKGKNPGDIFNINTHPYPEAHFATFPVALPIKILKCACPKQVCKKCGKPRETEYKSLSTNDYSKRSNYKRHIDPKHGQSAVSRNSYNMESVEYENVGKTDCGCNAGWEAGIVLDPFFGSGTTGVAAEKLGLRWIGIELNDEYVKIARKRLNMFRNKKLEDWFDD